MDKQWKVKSSFLNNCYEWLFTDEERKPIAFIAVFFMIVLISSVVCLFILSISRHIEFWI